MKYFILLAPLIAFSFSSCGKFFDKFSRMPEGFTQVSLQTDQSQFGSMQLGFLSPHRAVSSVLNGGVIVYARNMETQQIFSNSSATELGPLSLLLPNGNYDFYAVGWQNPNLDGLPTASSRLRCGRTPSTILSGGSAEVQIFLTDLNACYADPFSAPQDTKISSPYPTIGALKLVFCHETVELGGKAATDFCLGNQASSNFYRGNPAATEVRDAQYFSSSKTLLFTATRDKTVLGGQLTAPYELFRTNVDTGRQYKIPVPVTGGFGVDKIEKVPGKNKLVFKLRLSNGQTELWIYNLSTNALSKISQPPVANALGVREFRISPSGNHLVFVGEMDYFGKFELYSVAISDSDGYSAPRKISGLMNGPGIKSCNTCWGDKQFQFDISPGGTNAYVIYSAYQSSSSNADLHIATIDGSAIPFATIHSTSYSNLPSGSKISAAETYGIGSFAESFVFTPNGSHVAYFAHDATAATSNQETIYLTSISYSGSNLNVTFPTQLSNLAESPYFIAGKSSERIIFLEKKPSLPNYTTSVKKWTPSSSNILFDITTGFPHQLGDLTLENSDNELLGVVIDRSSPGVIRAVNVWSGSTIPNTNYTSTLVSYTGGNLGSTQQVKEQVAGDGGGFFQLSPDKTKIAFIADLTAAGRFELHYASVGDPATRTAVSGPRITSTKPVTAYTFGANEQLYFLSDLDVANQQELYQAGLATPHTETRLGALNNLHSMISLAKNSENPDLPWIPGMAKPIGDSGVEEIWAYDYSNGSFKRVTRLSGNCFGSGRVQIRLLKKPNVQNFETAFQSNCEHLSGTQFDGEQLQTAVNIPLGVGVPSPFAVAVDVYPLNDGSCSGTNISYTFPNGIGEFYNAGNGASRKLLGAGPGPVLFLKDP